MAVNNEAKTVPDQYGLSHNYPNPFNPVTTIEYSIKEAGSVQLKLFDITGQLVRTLVVNTSHPAGKFNVTFDGSQLASGIYFYHLKTKGYTRTRKLMLIK